MTTSTEILVRPVKSEPRHKETCFVHMRNQRRRSAAQLISAIVFATYTMQNKYSNCFVWVNPSTSDLIFHFQAWRWKRQSPDKSVHVKDCRIYKRSACSNVTLDFEASVQMDIADYEGKPKLFKPLLTHQNQEKQTVFHDPP